MGPRGPGRAGLDRGGVAPLRRRRPGRRPPPHLLPRQHGDHRARRAPAVLSRGGHLLGRGRRLQDRGRRGGVRREEDRGRHGLDAAPSPSGSTSPTISTCPADSDRPRRRWPRSCAGPSPQAGATAVFLPMGLANPDHVLTHDAGLLAREAMAAETEGRAGPRRRPGSGVRGRWLQAHPRPPGLADLEALPPRPVAHAGRGTGRTGHGGQADGHLEVHQPGGAPRARPPAVRAPGRQCPRAVLAAGPAAPGLGAPNLGG